MIARRVATELREALSPWLAVAQIGLRQVSKTLASYLDLLVDLLLVRRLEPWHANLGKRLVKSPRFYIRDSGLVHTLLRLETQDDVLGHPVAGAT